MLNKKTSIILATALTLATSSIAVAKEENMEKCYGIAKAGMNDCKSKDGSHNCKGHSQKDGDANEFMNVPSGMCNKIVGGKM